MGPAEMPSSAADHRPVAVSAGAVSGLARSAPEIPNEENVLERWQRRLLPLMILMVAGATLFFLVATVLQLNHLQTRIESAPTVDLTPALASLVDPPTAGERLVYAEWRTLALLEQQVLERRYHQANVLLMARTW